MTSTNSERSKEQITRAIEKEETRQLAAAPSPSTTGIIDNQDVWENNTLKAIEAQDTARVAAAEQPGIDDQDTARVTALSQPDIEDQETSRVTALSQPGIDDQETSRVVAVGQENSELPTRPVTAASKPGKAISRGTALIS